MPTMDEDEKAKLYNISDNFVPLHSISDDIIKDLINNLIPDDNEYGSAD